MNASDLDVNFRVYPCVFEEQHGPFCEEAGMRYSTLLTKLVLVLPARAWTPEFLARSTTHIKQDCPFDRKIIMEVGNSQRLSAVAPEIDCDSNDQSHMDVSVQNKTSRKDERNLSPDETSRKDERNLSPDETSRKDDRNLSQDQRKLARRLRKEAAKEQKKGESIRDHAINIPIVFVHHDRL